jgi:hypothetical protein
VKKGRPGALTKEEIALIAFIQYLQLTGFPAQRETVVAAANQILQSRDPQALELSSTWYSRFKTRHPEVTKTTVRSLEVSRYSCEASGEKHIENFFENHRNAVNSHNIGASECWNEDEMGIRQGVMSGKLEVLVILGDRKERPTLVNPNNRELVSLVGCANAAGIAIPPFVIFKSWPTEAWAEIQANEAIRFARSDTGFSNADIHFEWVHHFNIHSWKASAKAQRLGVSLEEWFGCD